MIGRTKEIDLLKKALTSKRPELIAVIGRRRVGKTYLIRTFFEDQIDFEMVGLRDGNMEQQLRNFAYSLKEAKRQKDPIEKVPKDWLEAFHDLMEHLESLEEKEKSLAPSIPSKGALYTFELGNLYFSQDEFEKAIATYSVALTMSPREAYTSIIRYQLALSYKKLNDCSSAVQVLDEIQERNPQYPEIDKVFIMAGDCYLDLQAYDKAETNYTNFINQFPDRKSLVADKLETARMFRRVNLSY